MNPTTMLVFAVVLLVLGVVVRLRKEAVRELRRRRENGIWLRECKVQERAWQQQCRNW